MNTLGRDRRDRDPAPAHKRRRRLLGLEPFFEGGWLHKGARAQHWDAEDELFALALLGDVTIDLSRANSTPTETDINAWAILRDVEVIVPTGTQVQITGGGLFGHLTNEAPDVPPDKRQRTVRVHGRTLLSDITVRAA